MVKYLLNRPIAVLLTFLVLIIFGIILFFRIPVSLLPDISIPEIVVKVNSPNESAEQIEKNITSILRNNFSTVDNVEDIQSQSRNNGALLTIKFSYNTRMDLAYIDINEKLDRIMASLPNHVERPEIIRINTSDVPIVRMQVIPKSPQNYIQISGLAERVIKKRLEQIDGISMVDINGRQNSVLVVKPKKMALLGVGLDEFTIANAIKQNNRELGALSVKDGQYSFHVKVTQNLDSKEQILSLPIRMHNGTLTPLEKFADVTTETLPPQGYHLFNGNSGLVITIHKHASARMNQLQPKIFDAMRQFAIDYPEINFDITQDQTFLLDEGIGNLTQDLLYGGFFCIILLFLFLGNYASPLLMGISIPISLVITFIFFYLFHISFNIISMSGLALGIGMLIDNSIVVLESITRKRKMGLSVDESCIQGVNEVMSPVIGNVLTTIAIYAPLIFLSGLAGSLIFDQAIALTISLAISLLVAFCLNPVLYKYFITAPPETLKEDTRIYQFILKGYNKMMTHIFSRKKIYFILAILVMPIGVILSKYIPVESLPKLSSTESIVKIDWDEPIDALQNKSRIQLITDIIDSYSATWEADIGIDQFLLTKDSRGVQKASIYFKTTDPKIKDEINEKLAHIIKRDFSEATFTIENAPNAFTQLFSNNEPYLEIRFRPLTAMSDTELSSQLNNLLAKVPLGFTKGEGFKKETSISMTIDDNNVLRYGISLDALREKLYTVFGTYNISKIKRFGSDQTIQLKEDMQDINHKLLEKIIGKDSTYFPLKTFVNYKYDEQMKCISADRAGEFNSISYDNIINKEILEESVISIAKQEGFSATFTGNSFKSKQLLSDMIVISLISVLMLYLILAIQFENLVYPFIVMLTIPLGFSGSVFLLWCAGGTFDIMAAIGFIVVFGIIVDDPSLKVETIIRLRKEYEQNNSYNKKEAIQKAIKEAGKICLKPLLMVSLTTSLALVPVFFSGGIGNELQRPLVYVIVGGLTIGTFFTLWFIPLAYLLVSSRKK